MWRDHIRESPVSKRSDDGMQNTEASKLSRVGSSTGGGGAQTKDGPRALTAWKSINKMRIFLIVP